MKQEADAASSLFSYFKVFMVLFLLGLLFFFVPLDRTLQLLLNVSLFWLGVVVVLRLIIFFVSSLKLYLLLPDPSLDGVMFNLLRVFGVYLSGKFFGNFLPTSVGGDVVKIRELTFLENTLSDASSAVLLERVTGILGVIFIVAGVSLPGVHLLGDYGLMGLRNHFLLLSLAVLVGTALAWSYLPKLQDYLEKYDDFPGIRSLRSFFVSLLHYHGNAGTLSAVLLMSVGYHLLRVVYLWLAIQAIGKSVPMLYLVPAIPIITFVSLIPVSINNLGLREGAITFVLTALGLTPVEALSVALLTRLIGYFLSIGGGLYYLGRSET